MKINIAGLMSMISEYDKEINGLSSSLKKKFIMFLHKN